MPGQFPDLLQQSTLFKKNQCCKDHKSIFEKIHDIIQRKISEVITTKNIHGPIKSTQETMLM